MSSNPFDPENDPESDPEKASESGSEKGSEKGSESGSEKDLEKDPEKDLEKAENDLEEPLVVGAVTPGPPPSFDPAPVPAPGDGGGRAAAFAGFAVAETKKPLHATFLASVILLIAVGTHYGWDMERGAYEGYAYSIPCISLVLSSVNMFLSKFSEDQYKKIGMHINLLNFLYSFIGVCCLTFYKPFLVTGNGYFAAWMLVYGTGTAVVMTVPAFGFNLQGTGAVMGLIGSSWVLLIASIGPIDDDYYKGEAVYSITLSCVTFVLGIVYLCYDKRSPASIPKVANFGILLALAIAWVPMACLVTFKGPFLATSNGYFAAWAGAAKAVVAAYVAMGDL